jgi:hypothetical protein
VFVFSSKNYLLKLNFLSKRIMFYHFLWLHYSKVFTTFDLSSTGTMLSNPTLQLGFAGASVCSFLSAVGIDFALGRTKES